MGLDRTPKPRISPEQKKKLCEYVRARRKSAEANKTVETLKNDVLSIVRLLGGRAVYLNGLMYQGDSVSYDYPATIKRRQEALNTKKKLMQLDGRAKKVTKEVLMFEDLLGKKNVPA